MPVEASIRMYDHDVLVPHHERDYKTHVAHPLPELEDCVFNVLRVDWHGRIRWTAVVGDSLLKERQVAVKDFSNMPETTDSRPLQGHYGGEVHSLDALQARHHINQRTTGHVPAGGPVGPRQQCADHEGGEMRNMEPHAVAGVSGKM